MEARNFQKKIEKRLIEIFGQDFVKIEFDSVKFDGRGHNHVSVYAPRVDIAVGPFNPYLPNHDIGIDDTEKMKQHPLTQKLFTEGNKGDTRGALDSLWNDLSRCYLAIEIEFNGSSKHIMGGIINAASSGSIGVVVGNKDTVKKLNRISNYLIRLNDYGLVKTNYLSNLWVFEDVEFLDFLKSIN